VYNDYRESSDSHIFNVQRVLFINAFNIGFRYPITDICATFTGLNNEIRFEKNHKIKTEAMHQFRMHHSVQRLLLNSLERDLIIPLFSAFNLSRYGHFPSLQSKLVLQLSAQPIMLHYASQQTHRDLYFR
jgi:hypothetical protein